MAQNFQKQDPKHQLIEDEGIDPTLVNQLLRNKFQLAWSRLVISILGMKFISRENWTKKVNEKDDSNRLKIVINDLMITTLIDRIDI